MFVLGEADLDEAEFFRGRRGGVGLGVEGDAVDAGEVGQERGELFGRGDQSSKKEVKKNRDGPAGARADGFTVDDLDGKSTPRETGLGCRWGALWQGANSSAAGAPTLARYLMRATCIRL